MSHAESNELERRVLILAPTRRDAEVTRRLLADAGLAPFVCDGLDLLAAEAARGASAVVLTDDAVEHSDPARFLGFLRAQPEWSELSIIMLVRSTAPGDVARHLSTVKGVTLLERPVLMRTLVSTVQAAIRARRRQYQVRHQLDEIRHQNRRLAAGEQWLRVAIQAGQFGAFQLDLATLRMECSPSCKDNFGIRPDEPFEYARLLTLIHPEDVERMRAAVGAAIAGDGMYHAEYRIHTPAGEERWIMARGQVLRDDPQGPARMVGVTLNVTDQKRAEAERERLLASERSARAQAEQANSAKDQFLAVLSHELRTPLTPVLATAQVMATNPGLSEDARDAFDMIRRNVELEARLIDDLLDLTRIVRGKLELQPVVVDVHSKVASVVAIVESDIRAKRLSLVTALDARDSHVRADPARLQQVLWNLLKNAIKFTPEGGTITVGTRSDGGRLCLSVVDTGVGIPPDVLPRLFNAFEQGGREMTRLFGGLGLGLAISKALVEVHGGVITVDSPGANRGATFSVELPVVRAPADRVTPSVDGDEAVGGSRVVSNCKILIVEDHADTARAMARILAGRGYTVRTADTVASALSAVGSDVYDLIISDIGLPDGSGLDLMRQILTRNPIRGIALSGFGMEEDVRRSKAAGFDSHLTKPVNIDRLEATVRRLTAHCAEAEATSS